MMPSYININCKEMIEKLNRQNEVKFSDIAKLKTLGKDKVSSLKEEQLIDLLSDETVRYIKQHLTCPIEQLTALRWAFRGLRADLTVLKIEVDKEINLNRKMTH